MDDVDVLVALGRRNKMDGYRIKQIGHDFVVFSGDVSVLKCQTEKDAQTIIAAASDLLENPDEWWNVLRQRLAASEAGRQSSNAGGDLAAFDTNAVTVTPNELA
jgi:hypothetical protein